MKLSSKISVYAKPLEMTENAAVLMPGPCVALWVYFPKAEKEGDDVG